MAILSLQERWGGGGRKGNAMVFFFLQLRDSNPHLAVKTSLDFCFGVYFCALVLGLCCVVVYFDVLLQFILALVSYSLFWFFVTIDFDYLCSARTYFFCLCTSGYFDVAVLFGLQYILFMKCYVIAVSILFGETFSVVFYPPAVFRQFKDPPPFFSHTSSLRSASISPLPSPHPRLFFALPPSPRWVSPNKVDCSQRTTGSVTASLTAKLLPAGSEGGRRRLLVCGLACPMACPISARTALIDHAARPHVPRPVGDTEPCLCWADS